MPDRHVQPAIAAFATRSRTKADSTEAASGGLGQSVTVQIVDSCPSQNAWNYFKTNVPAEQRCESSSLNALDIDQGAYMALTGQPIGSVSGSV